MHLWGDTAWSGPSLASLCSVPPPTPQSTEPDGRKVEFSGCNLPWGPFGFVPQPGPDAPLLQVDQMLQFATIDAAGNLDYKGLSYVLTHGEEKEE